MWQLVLVKAFLSHVRHCARGPTHPFPPFEWGLYPVFYEALGGVAMCVSSNPRRSPVFPLFTSSLSGGQRDGGQEHGRLWSLQPLCLRDLLHHSGQGPAVSQRLPAHGWAQPPNPGPSLPGEALLSQAILLRGSHHPAKPFSEPHCRLQLIPFKVFPCLSPFAGISLLCI